LERLIFFLPKNIISDITIETTAPQYQPGESVEMKISLGNFTSDESAGKLPENFDEITVLGDAGSVATPEPT
jgi:hypothetical protein